MYHAVHLPFGVHFSFPSQGKVIHLFVFGDVGKHWLYTSEAFAVLFASGFAVDFIFHLLNKGALFACFNSRFSRSSSLNLAAASEVIPGFLPESTFILLTQAVNVSGVQPILDETDTKAAHLDECSCSDVKTMRTARSRTSGEMLFISRLMPCHASEKQDAVVPNVRRTSYPTVRFNFWSIGYRLVLRTIEVD